MLHGALLRRVMAVHCKRTVVLSAAVACTNLSKGQAAAESRKCLPDASPLVTSKVEPAHAGHAA